MRARTPAPEDRDEATVRLARRRFARRQWARRWLAWRGGVVLLAGAGAVGVAVWLVFFSSVLAVSDVSVDGASVVGVDRVRQAAAVPTGEPLARVDLKAVAARVENLSAVKSVDVSRSWPDKVRIDVTERVPVAVVVREGVMRALDGDGVLFRRYASRPAGLPVVHMGAKTRADALAEAATVIGVLPGNLAAKVDYVEVRTIDTISLRLRNGTTIMWGSADQSHSKAQVLEVLLRQKATTYDVSVPGQPTLKR